MNTDRETARAVGRQGARGLVQAERCWRTHPHIAPAARAARNNLQPTDERRSAGLPLAALAALATVMLFTCVEPRMSPGQITPAIPVVYRVDASWKALPTPDLGDPFAYRVAPRAAFNPP